MLLYGGNAVLGVTRKLAAARLKPRPRMTVSTNASRLRRVSRAFLWMSIRSVLGNWIARHNQLLWFRSNGQRLERSQVARRVVGRPEMCTVSMSWRLPDDSKVIRLYT